MEGCDWLCTERHVQSGRGWLGTFHLSSLSIVEVYGLDSDTDMEQLATPSA